MRCMPEQAVTATKPHRCAFCGEVIATGTQHLLYRAFDPDRSKDGGLTWGAWVQARWHNDCRYPAPQSSQVRNG